MKDPRTIIKLPHVTEKSTDMKDKGWYVFTVDKKANKNEIKDSVEKIFDVKVEKIRIENTGIKESFPEINDPNLPNNGFSIELPLSQLNDNQLRLKVIGLDGKKYLSKIYYLD